MIIALTNSLALWSLLLVPCFFWGAYHYYKDQAKPEPIGMLALAIMLGYASAYLGLGLYFALERIGIRFEESMLTGTDPAGLFRYCVLVIGPVEEFVKFLPFILLLARTRYFDEENDGIIYAAFVALGFALHENRFYLAFLDGGPAVARAFISPIIHALFASIWGYAYGFAGRWPLPRWLTITLGLAVSMFLHGLYDYYAFAISLYRALCPPLIILLIWLWRMYTIRRYNRGLAGAVAKS